MTGLLLLYVGSLVSEHGLGQNLSHQLVEGIALCGLEDACWVSFFSGNVVLCVLYLQSFWDAYQLRQNYVRKRTYARISAPLVFSAMATGKFMYCFMQSIPPFNPCNPFRRRYSDIRRRSERAGRASRSRKPVFSTPEMRTPL